MGILILLSAALPAAAQQSASACDLVLSAALQREGQEAAKKQQNEVAVGKLQEALQACPAQRGILLELSQARLATRDFQGAIEAAKNYVQALPGSVPGHVVLANAYFMDQKLVEAKAEAERALQAAPYQPVALKIKGNAEYLLGQADQAQKTLMDLLEHHPEDEDGAYMLGRIYYQEGRIDYAIGQFDRVLKIDPNNYKAYDNLGLCYEARSETETAIRYFLTAIKLVETAHPEYDWPYANLSNLLIDKGDFEQAFSAAVKAAKRNPGSARNFYLAGKALWKLDKLDLSVKWLGQSAKLDPNYPEPLYLLARIYSQLGRQAEAGEALRKFREVKAKAPRQRR